MNLGIFVSASSFKLFLLSFDFINSKNGTWYRKVY